MFSLKQVTNNFGYVSGLKLNEEKTEAHWFGSLHDSPEDLGIDKVNKPMKILSIFFTYEWQNFQELKSIKNLYIHGNGETLLYLVEFKSSRHSQFLSLSSELLKFLSQKKLSRRSTWYFLNLCGNLEERKYNDSDYKNGGLFTVKMPPAFAF